MNKKNIIKSIRLTQKELESINQILENTDISFSELVKNNINLSRLDEIVKLKQEKNAQENAKIKSKFLKEIIFQLRAIGYNLFIATERARNSKESKIENLNYAAEQIYEVLNNLYNLLYIIHKNNDFSISNKIANDELVAQGESERLTRKALNIQSTIKQELAKNNNAF
ncbi:hypothetical protein CINF_a0005 (plasmid) [Candidatus Campylobacter infans]|jgi:hypothetical protein|uniref:Uncharacterized protein n=1 Tax=Candidatus Campylobacter infans TaxID=2561898 RepID=A0A7H9CJQ7_9BACT|nr:hypothetical protein [Candidatus Campylobacter infans]QLI06232.1 hypothetical protein CINF_a0005 [Candidatus Campylobacter infans]